MHRLTARVLVFCLTALALAVPASAQTTPKVELSGGYQFLNFSLNGENESMPVGWYFDVAGNLTPMLGVVFQVGGNYKTFDESVAIGGITVSASADLKVHEFLGGMRVNLRSGGAVVPFGQFLVGGINGSIKVSASTTIPGQPPITVEDEDSSTNFGLQAGGGVNFGLTDAIGVRAGADYLRVFAEDEGANLFRVHVGVVIGR
jgi:opacity protein-like surface antigen